MIKLSKQLTKYLRHAAKDLSEDGYIGVDRMCKMLACTRADIERCVLSNDKKRLELSSCGTRIRAVQGHSIPVKIETMQEICDFRKYSTLDPATNRWEVFHGTSRTRLGGVPSVVLERGLSRMTRNHIHMVSSRSSSRILDWYDIIVTIDIFAAMVSGIKFYISTNDVILSPGDESGVIPFRFLTIKL